MNEARFLRVAAVCSAISSVTTLLLIFLPDFFINAQGFEARMARVHEPAYILRSWVYLLHPFLVLTAGLGIMLATQSPGDLDYKSRDQITSWFIGRVREDTALRKLRAAFQSESGLDPAVVLPGQTVGEFHLVQEGLVRPMRAQRSLISAEQVPFDRIEQLARETKGQDEKQLKLFA